MAKIKDADDSKYWQEWVYKTEQPLSKTGSFQEGYTYAYQMTQQVHS